MTPAVNSNGLGEMASQVLHLNSIFSNQYFWFFFEHVCPFKVQTAKSFVFPNPMQTQ